MKLGEERLGLEWCSKNSTLIIKLGYTFDLEQAKKPG